MEECLWCNETKEVNIDLQCDDCCEENLEYSRELIKLCKIFEV